MLCFFFCCLVVLLVSLFVCFLRDFQTWSSWKPKFLNGIRGMSWFPNCRLLHFIKRMAPMKNAAAPAKKIPTAEPAPIWAPPLLGIVVDPCVGPCVVTVVIGAGGNVRIWSSPIWKRAWWTTVSRINHRTVRAFEISILSNGWFCSFANIARSIL